jgi:uncharacterized membrane protein YvbJ
MVLWAIFAALVVIIILILGLGTMRLNPEALEQRLERTISLLGSISGDVKSIRESLQAGGTKDRDVPRERR